ncbi:MAG: hypothetical protein J2P37_35695, partial [Ktedonobacteraceae bacterium]|nr:hypothetical protein [Ktedonobacteraceae bacterium]
MNAMQRFYGAEKGKKVFYASTNKGNIWGARTPSAHWPNRSPGARRSALRAKAWAKKRSGDEGFDEDFDDYDDENYDALPDTTVEPARPNTNIEQANRQITPFGASKDQFAPMTQTARTLDDDQQQQRVLTSPGETHTDPHTWPWESVPWKPPVKGDAWDSPNWSWERTQKRTYPDGSTDTATFKVSPQQPKAPAAPAPQPQVRPQPGPQPQMRAETQSPRPPQQSPSQMPRQQPVTEPPAQPVQRPKPAQMPAQTDANGIGIRSAYEQGRQRQSHPGGIRETYMQGIQRRHNATDQSQSSPAPKLLSPVSIKSHVHPQHMDQAGGLRRTGSAVGPGGQTVQTQSTPQQRLDIQRMQPSATSSSAASPQQRLKRQNTDNRFATDPPVSEKQRGAMQAAAAGKSTIGIPQSVGKKYLEHDAQPVSLSNQMQAAKTLDNVIRDALVGAPTRTLQDRVDHGWTAPQFTGRDDTPAPDLDEERNRRPSGVMGQIERSRKVRLLPRGRLPPKSAWPGSPSASNANPQSSGLQR